MPRNRTWEPPDALFTGVRNGLPFVGTAFPYLECEAGDMKCSAELLANFTGDLGGLIIPFSKTAATFTSLSPGFLRGTETAGKVLLGVSIAGDVGLAIDDMVRDDKA